MFVIGASEPVRSGKGSAMPYPTNELVQRVWSEISDVAETTGKQLSASFGNFDKLVGAGWLIGDVIQDRLIDRADAFAVGRRVGKLAPTLKLDFAAPSRCAGKRKHRSEEERVQSLREAAEEERALRAAEADLPLPPPPKRRCQPATSTGDTTPAATPAASPVPTEPTLKELRAAVDAAEAAFAVTHADCSRAKQAHMRAVDAADRDFERSRDQIRLWPLDQIHQLDDKVAEIQTEAARLGKRKTATIWLQQDCDELHSAADQRLFGARLDLASAEDRAKRQAELAAQLVAEERRDAQIIQSCSEMLRAAQSCSEIVQRCSELLAIQKTWKTVDEPEVD